MGFAVKNTEDLDFKRLVYPQNENVRQCERLNEEVSKFYLRIFFASLKKGANHDALLSLKPEILALLDLAHSRLKERSFFVLAREPEFTAVTWRMRDRFFANHWNGIEDDLCFLKSLLLEALPGQSAFTLRCPIKSDWYQKNYPRDPESRASPVDFDATTAQLELFFANMNEGCALIHQHWPALSVELRAFVSALLPLKAAANPLAPHNQSVHAFRGLICAAPRPSYFAAQTLAHEMTHNKFSSIQDLALLFENSPEESYYSPFVKAPRPLANLFHGVASFLADASISIRMLGKVDELPSAPMEPYIAKIIANIDEAQQTILSATRFTKEGRAVYEGFCEFRSALF